MRLPDASAPSPPTRPFATPLSLVARSPLCSPPHRTQPPPRHSGNAAIGVPAPPLGDQKLRRRPVLPLRPRARARHHLTDWIDAAFPVRSPPSSSTPASSAAPNPFADLHEPLGEPPRCSLPSLSRSSMLSHRPREAGLHRPPGPASSSLSCPVASSVDACVLVALRRCGLGLCFV